MIARHWKGIAKSERAGAYINHLLSETIPELKKIDGFHAASVLRRPIAAGIEFLVITSWDSMDAIRQFAGKNTDQAVVPDNVRDMMIDFDEIVVHYEVVL